jgi:hypothetical protein
LVAEVLEQAFHAFLNHLIVIFLGRHHLLQGFLVRQRLVELLIENG